MATLITLLISLLGYGSPADFEQYTEAQLETQIENTQNAQNADGGEIGDWDVGHVY